MAFVPRGKKTRKKWDRERKVDDRERVLDAVISGVRLAIPHPKLCLPTCVLAQRMLDLLPTIPRLELKLGALAVFPVDEAIAPIAFDPRGPDGIDGGFHAWLADERGHIVDPSIFVTLNDAGYDVEAGSYLLIPGPRTIHAGLRFVYEELPELELLGLEESEPALSLLMRHAMTGEPPRGQHTVHLDVDWRLGCKP